MQAHSDALEAEGRLDGYHLPPSVRGDLLERLGLRRVTAAQVLRPRPGA